MRRWQWSVARYLGSLEVPLPIHILLILEVTKWCADAGLGGAGLLGAHMEPAEVPGHGLRAGPKHAQVVQLTQIDPTLSRPAGSGLTAGVGWRCLS